MAGDFSFPETEVGRTEQASKWMSLLYLSTVRKTGLLTFIKRSGIKSAQFDASGWVTKD